MFLCVSYRPHDKSEDREGITQHQKHWAQFPEFQGTFELRSERVIRSLLGGEARGREDTEIGCAKAWGLKDR